MDMLINKVDAKMAPDLIDLAPYHVLCNVALEDYRSFVAYMEEDGKTSKAGFIQYLVSKDEYKLSYIYILKKYRKMGAGRGIVSLFLDEAKKNDINDISACVFDGDLLDVSRDEMVDFLLKTGFKDKKTRPGPFLFDGNEIFRQEYYSEVRSKGVPKGVIPLGEQSSSEIAGALDSLKLSDDDRLPLVNRKMSFFHETNGVFDGALLVKSAVDEHYVFLLTAEKAEVQKKLLEAFLFSLAENIRLTDRVMIEDKETVVELMNMFFPDLKRQEEVVVS